MYTSKRIKTRLPPFIYLSLSLLPPLVTFHVGFSTSFFFFVCFKLHKLHKVGDFGGNGGGGGGREADESMTRNEHL